MAIRAFAVPHTRPFDEEINSAKSVQQSLDHLIDQNFCGVGRESGINQFEADHAVDAGP
jgi:hypothetical protein